MRLIFRWAGPAAVLVLAALASQARAGGGDPNEDHDMQIGQDGTAAHKIIVQDEDGFHHLEGQPIVLTPGDGLNDGYYVHPFPGFDSKAAVPFPLLDGNELTLLRISSTNAAFDMLDPFTGTPILGTDGATFLFPFGGGLGHEDVFYRADGSQVNLGDTFSVTFQLTDPSGLDSASDPFTFNFVVAPEPTTLALLGLAGLAFRRRFARP